MIANWNSERLRASPISMLHIEEICRLHSDPRVMRTLSADGAVLSDKQSAETIANAEDHWKKHGYGFWAFHSLEEGEFVGRAGFKHYTLEDLGDRQEVGLAYAVISSLWNRGFANEMAQEIIRIGFSSLGLANIASWTLHHNVASQRVMEKLGFRYETDFIFAGLPHKFYTLKPESFEQHDQSHNKRVLRTSYSPRDSKRNEH